MSAYTILWATPFYALSPSCLFGPSKRSSLAKTIGLLVLGELRSPNEDDAYSCPKDGADKASTCHAMSGAAANTDPSSNTCNIKPRHCLVFSSNGLLGVGMDHTYPHDDSQRAPPHGNISAGETRKVLLPIQVSARHKQARCAQSDVCHSRGMAVVRRRLTTTTSRCWCW